MAHLDDVSTAGQTPYDGDPRFEALVYGWACSDTRWNGARDTATGPRGEVLRGEAAAERTRDVLAGCYEQWLQQQPADPAGPR